jgi:hypothetical protein
MRRCRSTRDTNNNAWSGLKTSGGVLSFHEAIKHHHREGKSVFYVRPRNFYDEAGIVGEKHMQIDALEDLARIRAELLDTIAGLDEAALDRKGAVGDWSVKNVLAHLAAWEDWVVQVLPVRIETGKTPDDFRTRAENEDRFNAEEVAEREELTADEQLMELERTREALVAYVWSLDPATLNRPQPWETWPGTLPEYLVKSLGEHEAEHIAELRSAVGKMGR